MSFWPLLGTLTDLSGAQDIIPENPNVLSACQAEHLIYNKFNTNILGVLHVQCPAYPVVR